ncbi:sigma-70 family RNA polymerase sigma factor [Corynebacterium aquatimens]|uniref:RNA polymerase sigma-70 factor (ECF subfamily) n=1 Tax=Corynebacterium aquatimens TaxID=1190508 RepID=A0A931E1W6_9CORY|nr:sigma-70 family RNA polymerase sigma factor [Corynebacterium aquatimens]MBG6122723.1 RNA polymerase sigma-70 factor (ECF subfamily) [Corynebacterium aquatimens]WJY66940.1 ECF RNA polymerase sigma factor SigM [Corynebacterium aquatimens]
MTALSTRTTATGTRRTTRTETNTNRTDQALVKAYLDGDDRAFTLIVRRYSRMLHVAALKYARNDFDAEDIVQNALLNASAKMHTFRSDAALTTWLHKLVQNAGYDYMTRGENGRNHLSIYAGDGVHLEVNERYMHNPLENLERLLEMRKVLAELPVAQRRALLLMDVAGMTVDKAARELGVAEGTVKSRRNRARQAVAKHLAEL